MRMPFAKRPPNVLPGLPRLGRERDALMRLANDAPNAMVAEMARIKLRAVEFASRYATSTPAAWRADAARDAAGMTIAPLDNLPRPPERASGGHLVDISSKLPALDAIAGTNHERYAKATRDAVDQHVRTHAAAAHARLSRTQVEALLKRASEGREDPPYFPLPRSIDRWAPPRIAFALSAALATCLVACPSEAGEGMLGEASAWAFVALPLLGVLAARTFVGTIWACRFTRELLRSARGRVR